MQHRTAGLGGAWARGRVVPGAGVLLVAAGTLCASAWGQAEVVASSGVPGGGSVTGVGTGAALGAAALLSEDVPQISFTFEDQPFADVIAYFQRETGLSVVYEAGAPDARLRFVSVEPLTFVEALDILNLNLRQHGVMLQREKNYLYLRKLENAAKSPFAVVDPSELDGMPGSYWVNVAIPLNRLDAVKTAEQVKGLIREPGTAFALPDQNMVVVIETAAQARRVRELVQRFDLAEANESYRVFAIRNAKASDVLGSLQGLVGQRVQQVFIDKDGNRTVVQESQVPGLNMQVHEPTNSIIAVGPPVRLEAAAEIIALLDVGGGGGAGARMVSFAMGSMEASAVKGRIDELFAREPEASRPIVQAIDEAGRLMVVGSEAQIGRAGQLLALVDPGALAEDGTAGVVQRAERTTRLIELTSGSAAGFAEAAQAVLTAGQRRAVTIVPLGDDRSVIVNGPTGDVEAVAGIASAFASASEGPREVRVLRVTEGEFGAVVEELRELDRVSGGEVLRGVEVYPDAEQRVLRLAGARAALGRAESALAEAALAARVEPESRRYVMSVRGPSEVAATLLRLAEPLLRPADGSAYVPPTVEVIDELDTLIVRAGAGQFEVIEGLLEQIDVEKPGDRLLRVLTLEGSSAGAVVERARALYAERSRGLSEREAGAVDVEVDRVSGRVLVRGGEAGLGLFEACVRDAQQLVPPERVTRLIDVEHVAASALIGPVRELLATADPIDALREVRPAEIEAVELTNSLLVRGEEAQQRLIEELVRKLDRIAPESMPPMRLIQVRSADAVQIAALLADQYSRRPLPERQAKPVEVRADAESNTLIVSAHESVFAEIRSFVAELIEPEDTGAPRKTFLFPLTTARAEAVASAMDQLFPAPPSVRDRFGRVVREFTKEVTVAADLSSNSLIIDAPVEREKSLVELAEKLDRVVVPPAAELRTWRVEEADLSVIRETLLGLARTGTLSKAAGAGGRAVEVAIEVEPRSKTLIVAGDEVTFAKVDELLRSLSRVDVERELRIVPISNARASAVAGRAQTIYAAQVSERRDLGPVSVSVDEKSNSLEVVGETEALDAFVAVIEQLQRQAGPAREVRLIELELARASAVVTTLRSMASASESLREGGGPEPVFEAVAGTNAIMVAAQPAQMPVIEQIVRGIDREQTGVRPPLRVLRLRTTDAVGLAEVLQRNYEQRPAEERVLRPVQVSADEATNTLIVSAAEELLPEIERIVETLNRTEGLADSDRGIVVIPLKHARAEELAATIDELYPERPVPLDSRRQPRPDLQQPKEISVRGDGASNSLIVDAPRNRLEEFRTLIEQLDQARVVDNLELKAFTVRVADAEAVATTIRELAGSGALRVPAQGAVTVTVEPVRGTLIVSAPAEAFAQIEEVVRRLEPAAGMPELSIRMYPLTHARAERLAPVVERLLSQQAEAEIGAGELAGLVEVGRVLDVSADRSSNTLIVWTTAGLHELAAKLIAAMDSEASASGRAGVRIVPVQFAEAGQLAADVQAALPALDLVAADEVSVVAAAGSNAVIVAGPERDIKRVEEELIARLDRRVRRADELDARTFTLVNADASAVAATVEGLLASDAGEEEVPWWARSRPVEDRPKVRVQADASTNAVMVTGPASTVELAAAVIERLDQPSAGGRVVEVFTPARGEPAAIVESVQLMMRSGATGSAGRADVFADGVSRSVVVSGSGPAVSAAMELLREIDGRSVVAPSAEVASFELRNVDAEQAAATLSAMLGDEARWPRELLAARAAGLAVPMPSVMADTGANRLIVSMPSGLGAMARALIATLDSPASERAVDVRVFALTRGRAESVASALQTAIAAGVKPGERMPSVTAEPTGNSVIVAASPERLALVETLIEAMDSGEGANAGGARTVFLKHARAELLAPLVRQLLAGEEEDMNALDPWERRWFRQMQARDRLEGQTQTPVRVMPDQRLNALVITGPVAQLDMAEQIAQGLDVAEGSGAGGPGVGVEVITLVNADAGELASNLTAMFEDEEGGGVPPRITVDTQSNSLLVRGSSAQLREVSRIAERLDQASVASRRSMRSVPIDRSRASAAAVAAQLRAMLGAGGGISVEVIGVEELMGGGGEEPAGAAEPEMPAADGDRSDAGPAAGATVEAVASRMVASAAIGQPIGGGGQLESGDGAGDAGRVTIAVDEATNSLIVVGSPVAAERIAMLAEQLQAQLPAAPAAVRIVELPEASDPFQVAEIVRQTIEQVGQSTAENPSGFTGPVNVVAEPGSRAVVVWANETDFAAIGKLIAGVTRAGRVTDITVKVYALENIDAGSAGRAVQDLLARSPRGRQAQRVQPLRLTVEGAGGARVASFDAGMVSVTPDPLNGSLIVSAPSEAMAAIDRFIALLDRTPEAERESVRRYGLKHANAGRAQQAIERLLGTGSRRRGEGLLQPVVAADPEANAILVTASERDHRRVREIVEQLDQPAAQADRPTELFALKTMVPSAAERLISDIYIGRDQQRRTRVEIAADDEAGLLIVKGPEADLAAVRELVTRVDTEAEGDWPLRTILLSTADAQYVAEQISQLFEGRGAGGRRVRITGDQRSGTLAVVADDESYAQIAEMAKAFDNPAEDQQMQQRVYVLKHVQVQDIEDFVEQMGYGFRWGNQGRRTQNEEFFAFTSRGQNAVIMMGGKTVVDSMVSLLEEIDQPRSSEIERVVRVVEMPGVEDLWNLAELVEEATATPQRYSWYGSDSSRVFARADPAGQRIVLLGPGAKVERAVEMLEEIAKGAKLEGVATRSIALEHARAPEAAGDLTAALEARARSVGKRTDGFSIVGSEAGNTLIISADAEDFELIERLLVQIDRPDLGDDRVYRVFTLANAGAVETATTIEQIFPSGRRPEDRLIVTPESGKSRIIVSAPTGEVMAEVASLIATLDAAPSVEANAGQTVRTIELERANAESVAAALRSALPVGLSVQITPVVDTNSIILTGSPEAVTLAAAQVGTLDVAADLVKFRTFPVKYVDAFDADLQLNRLVANIPGASGARPRIDSTTSPPQIMVTATDEQLALIEQMIAQIDRPGPVTTTEFVKLEFARAESAAQILRPFFGVTARSAATAEEREVSVIADPGSDSLIISASEAVWPKIRALVERIDIEQNQDQVLRVIPLKHASAEAVARALNEGFSAPLERAIRERTAQQAGGGEGGGEGRESARPAQPEVIVSAQGTPSVSAEPVTNSLVVFADRRSLERIEAVVGQLDVPAMLDLPQPRLIPVSGGRAEQLAQTALRTLTGERGVDSRRVLVIGDDRAGVIVVRADDTVFEQVRSLVTELEAAGRTRVEVMRLRSAPAGQVVQTLRQTFGPMARERGEALTLAVHASANAVVVSGSDAMLRDVATVAGQLDGAGAGAGDGVGGGAAAGLGAMSVGRGVFVFEVQHTSPAEIVRMLGEMGLTEPVGEGEAGLVTEPVRVIPLTTRRAVTVICLPIDAPRVESIIQSLDLPGGAEAAGEDMVRVPLERASAAEVVRLLQRVVNPAAQDVENESARSLAEHIRRLNVSRAEAGQGPLVLDLSKPIRLIADEAGNAVLIGSTGANVEALSELARLLDTVPTTAGFVVRIFPLRNAEAFRLANVITELFREGRRLGRIPGTDREALPGGVAGPGLAGEISVQVDERTNSLVVAGQEQPVAVAEALIEKLDSGEADPANEVRVVTLKHARASSVAQTLQQWFFEREFSGPMPPADRLVLTVDDRTNTLIVSTSAKSFAVLETLLATLDEPVGGEAAYERTEIITIRSAGRADEIREGVEALYAEPERRRRGDDALRIVVSERQNALVVSGAVADIEAVRKLVEQLDKPEVELSQEIRKIKLSSANAGELVQQIEDLLWGRGGGGAGGQAARLRMIGGEGGMTEATIDRGLREQTRITADARTNSILVKAPIDLMGLIEKIVQDLDSDVSGDRKIELFQLTNADARQMQRTLAELFNLRQEGDRLVLVPRASTEADDRDDSRIGAGTFVPSPDTRQELAITIDRRTNAILVSGTPEYLEQVREVVQRLDRIELVERESFVYPLRNARAGEVQETLQTFFESEAARRESLLTGDLSGSVVQRLEQEVTVVGDELSNTMLITVSPRFKETVLLILRELDASPPQVQIQVMLAEVTLDDEDSWGMDIDIGRDITTSQIGGDGYVFNSLAAGAGITSLGVPNLTLESRDFQLLIRALESQGRLEVLSRPTLTVNNNETASLQVGEQVVIPTGTTITNDNVVANTENQDVGIILTVTPSISKDGFVRMDISPEISSVSQRTTEIGTNFEAPIITQRTVDTTVTVKDGQTVVIGGLIQTQTELRTEKRKLLGNIPIVGALFNSRLETNVKTELLVILTPRVIPGESPAFDAAQQSLRESAIRRLSDPKSVIDALREDTGQDLTPPPAPSADAGLRPQRAPAFIRSQPVRRPAQTAPTVPPAAPAPAPTGAPSADPPRVPPPRPTTGPSSAGAAPYEELEPAGEPASAGVPE